MGSYRFIPPIQVFNASVSGVTAVKSTRLDLRTLAIPAFLVVVGSGLTATFQLLASMDDVTYIDTGAQFPSASGSALSFWINPGAVGFPYVKVQITPSSGTGTVTVTGSAK